MYFPVHLHTDYAIFQEFALILLSYFGKEELHMNIRASNHPRGLTSLGFLGHFTALLLVIAGGQGIYVTLTNSEPVEITTTDFVAKKPDAKWLVLKEAEVSLTEAAYKSWMGNISEIFIPVRPSGHSMNEPIHILLATEDEAVATALKKLREYGGTKQKTINVASQQADKLFMQKDISGLIRFGIVSDFITRFRLARLNLPLADDFVILDDDTTPTPYRPLAMLAGGLLIWFLMLCEAIRVAAWRRQQRRRAFNR